MTGDKVEKDKMIYGSLSDQQVATMVRMLIINDHDREAVCCAARDRIMYLSQQLEHWKTVAVEAASMRDAHEACTLVDQELANCK